MPPSNLEYCQIVFRQLCPQIARLLPPSLINSSIGDLLTNEDSVDMRKATIMLWRNRDKPEVISELAEVLSEVRLHSACTAGFCPS